MKIAVIAPSQVPSSTANSIQVMKVCQAFTQLGHKVRLWLPGGRPASWEDLTEIYGLNSTFEINWLPSSLIWKRYDLAYKALIQASRWKADVIYTWMLQTAAMSQIADIPFILEMHMPPSGHLGPLLYKRIVKKRGRKRLLFITDALRLLLEEKYHLALPQSDYQISPMGSEPDRFDELPDNPSVLRQQLGLPEGFTVGYAGHFYPGRGIDLLLELAASMSHIHFLWIGGRQSDLDYWKDQLNASNIFNVTMTGFVNNRHIPSYLSASDILLMPYGTKVGVSSRGNTADVCSPMKMFDYLSAGRAIITSDLPVLHEVLNESNTIFCPPDDIHAWKQAIERLYSNEEICKSLATQAKQDSQKYTWFLRAQQSIRNFP